MANGLDVKQLLVEASEGASEGIGSGNGEVETPKRSSLQTGQG